MQKTIVWKQLNIKIFTVIIFMQNARIFLHPFQRFCVAIGFWLSNPSFVFSDIGGRSSYLLAHAWDRRKIRFRYDTTSWFTDSPIASAMSCPQMPTAELLPHNAPRSVVTPQGLDRAEVARGGAYIFVCMYECVWTWALMQQREQREFTMYLSPPVHPIFSVRWSASCRRLNRGFLANVRTLKYLLSRGMYVNEQSRQFIIIDIGRVALDAWIAIEIFLPKFCLNVFP